MQGEMGSTTQIKKLLCRSAEQIQDANWMKCMLVLPMEKENTSFVVGSLEWKIICDLIASGRNCLQKEV